MPLIETLTPELPSQASLLQQANAAAIGKITKTLRVDLTSEVINGLPNANLAVMPTLTVKGNNSVDSAVPQDLTLADLTAMGIGSGTISVKDEGVLQSSTVDTMNFVGGLVSSSVVGSTATITVKKYIQIAASDQTTAITVGTGKVTFRMPQAMTLTEVRASLTTASSSGIPTFNIKESGTTIFSTKLTIDAGEKTSVTAATPAVISDAALADDAEITIDFDVAGTGAAGVVITLIGT